jgi:hypothetical protein
MILSSSRNNFTYPAIIDAIEHWVHDLEKSDPTAIGKINPGIVVTPDISGILRQMQRPDGEEKRIHLKLRGRNPNTRLGFHSYRTNMKIKGITAS